MTTSNSPTSLHTTHLTTVAAPIGDYVIYKGVNMVIVDFNDNCSMFKLLNPSTQVKLMVGVKNISATNYTPMSAVRRNGSNYLVSKKGMIISLTTGRVMNWSTTDHNRADILAA